MDLYIFSFVCRVLEKKLNFFPIFTIYWEPELTSSYGVSVASQQDPDIFMFLIYDGPDVMFLIDIISFMKTDQNSVLFRIHSWNRYKNMVYYFVYIAGIDTK